MSICARNRDPLRKGVDGKNTQRQFGRNPWAKIELSSRYGFKEQQEVPLASNSSRC